MECKTCKHWQKKKTYGGTIIQEWGICNHLISGMADIDFYTNNREGEWVQTTVRTLPDWFCKEYEKKEGENGSIDG